MSNNRIFKWWDWGTDQSWHATSQSPFCIDAWLESEDFELMKAAGLNVLRLGALLCKHMPQNQWLCIWNVTFFPQNWSHQLIKEAFSQFTLIHYAWRCHVAWSRTTTRHLQWNLSSYRQGHRRGSSYLWDLCLGWYAPGAIQWMYAILGPADQPFTVGKSIHYEGSVVAGPNRCRFSQVLCLTSLLVSWVGGTMSQVIV